MTVTTSSTASTAPAKSGRGRKRRSEVRKTSLLAHGEPMVWLTGGALVVAIAMISAFGPVAVLSGTTFTCTRSTRRTTSGVPSSSAFARHWAVISTKKPPISESIHLAKISWISPADRPDCSLSDAPMETTRVANNYVPFAGPARPS